MVSSSPQITAIICTYRRPYWLQRAILSILNQTYGNFQICVYDNASGDETADIVAELARQDARIRYIRRPQNIGLLANYADAMQQVKTPFFAFLGDDDVILPNFYETALQAMAEHPAAMFFASSFLDLSLTGRRVYGHQFADQTFLPPAAMFQFIESNKAPNLHGTLLRREVIGSRAEFGTVHSWADVDFLLQVAACYPVLTSATECVLITSHDLDKQHRTAISDAWVIQDAVSKNLQPLLTPEDYQKVQAILQPRIREAIYFTGIEVLYQGNFEEAKIGSRKLRQDYGSFWSPLILDAIAFAFQKLPWLRQFLRATRKSHPIRENKAPRILGYGELMNIYQKKSY
jgi:glycosyltransferase involved in cell wall biosynthesis